MFSSNGINEQHIRFFKCVISVTLRRLFGYFNPACLKKSYFIAIFFFLLALSVVLIDGMVGHVKDYHHILDITFVMALETVLFPFSKYVWLLVRDSWLGDTAVMMPALVSVPLNILLNGFIFAGSLCAGPIGVAHILYKTRHGADVTEAEK